jgi:preprotein translocase subunit SecD
VSAETDTEVAGIQSDLQQNGITGATVSKPDANRVDFIQISGVPAARNDDVRSLLESRYSNRFDIGPGVGNSWTLTMKPSVENDAKQRALDQAIEVITTRTNTLGVSEPIIEPYQLGSGRRRSEPREGCNPVHRAPRGPRSPGWPVAR